jgi:flagellar protein FliS
MNTPNSQVAYQEAAVRNGGPIDLIIVLYDILSRDLQRAVAAMQAGNIEERTRHLKHGFLALQQLDATLNLEEGGALVTSMARFYDMLRTQMMSAQVRQDPAVLQNLQDLLFSVREAWTELKAKLSSAGLAQSRRSAGSAFGDPEVRSSSWNG